MYAYCLHVFLSARLGVYIEDWPSIVGVASASAIFLLCARYLASCCKMICIRTDYSQPPGRVQLCGGDPPPVQDIITKFAGNSYLSRLTVDLTDQEEEEEGEDSCIQEAVQEFRSLLSCYAALKLKAATLSQENQELIALLQHVARTAPQRNHDQVRLALHTKAYHVHWPVTRGVSEPWPSNTAT